MLRGHRVERRRQLAELIARADRDLVGEVPRRTRSVPVKSSWTDPVIDRASVSPIMNATT